MCLLPKIWIMWKNKQTERLIFESWQVFMLMLYSQINNLLITTKNAMSQGNLKALRILRVINNNNKFRLSMTQTPDEL